MSMDSVSGRKAFQVKDIKWSYRRRGSVARTQTNNIVKNVVSELRVKVRGR